MGGICQVAVLSDTQTPAPGIAIDSKDVYWTYQSSGPTVGGGIGYVATDGGNPGGPLLGLSNTFAGIALNSATGGIYFTDGAWLYFMTPFGGVNPMGVSDYQSSGIAIDNANARLFVSDMNGLESVSLSTRALTPWITSTGSSWGVVADGTHVFQADANSGTVVACSETAPCGNTPQVLATGLTSLWAIASDGTDVWFTTLGTSAKGYADGAIYRCSVTGACGSPPGPFISNQPKPTAVVSDGSNVYWGSALGGISKCPVVGCPDGGPSVISSDSVTSMTQDASALYFTSPSGIVGKLAK
jgi:hypothetical protein